MSKKLSELPDFEGKALAFEVQQLGVALNTGITAASDLMVLGLVQVVAKLQAEVAHLTLMQHRSSCPDSAYLQDLTGPTKPV